MQFPETYNLLYSSSCRLSMDCVNILKQTGANMKLYNIDTINSAELTKIGVTHIPCVYDTKTSNKFSGKKVLEWLIESSNSIKNTSSIKSKSINDTPRNGSNSVLNNSNGPLDYDSTSVYASIDGSSLTGNYSDVDWKSEQNNTEQNNRQTSNSEFERKMNDYISNRKL
jgi:hypothetical protein